jgi:hypothetical protein
MAPWLAAQTSVPPKAGTPPTDREVAILQIRLVEGEGAIHAAGSKALRGLSVEVTDETGRPVAGAAVSFRLPGEGPSGIFANGMRTEVVISGPAGRATVWGIQWNRVEGPFQVRITAAKGQARAGTVVSQYLSQTVAPKQGGSVLLTPSKNPSGSRSKWLLITAVVVGTAVGGVLAAGLARGSPASAATAAAASSPALGIGTPSITIGRP